jgi:hypothetical protein
MPSEDAVFELTDGTREVSAILPGGRTVVIKTGKRRKSSSPEESAIWRGAEGVREVKSKRPAAKKSTTKKGGGSTAATKQGAASATAPNEGGE